MKRLEKLASRINYVAGWVAVAITAMVGVLFAVYLAFRPPSQNTLEIAVGGTAISVALASLCFGYSALGNEKEHRIAIYVGERFSFAAVLLVLGLVLDYAQLNAASVLPFRLPSGALWFQPLGWILWLCRVFSYVSAVFGFSLGAGLAYQVFIEKDKAVKT